jgi:uncharacterized protein YjbI with pentapeptide repeats
VNLDFANLLNCNFGESMLKNASMRQARISKSSFVGANLISADLFKVIAKDCNFSKSRLARADMREGDFENSNFNEASLYEANLERANLQFCTLTNTDLNRAHITGLRGSVANGPLNSVPVQQI